jgi:alpha-tubulin suppressor-like RCC1 family protein
MTMTRREALKLFAASPLAAAQAVAQPAPARGRRIISEGPITYLLDPDGTVKGWAYTDPFGWSFGLGHANRVKPYVAFDIPGLTNVVDVAAAVNTTYALLANGTVMAWGGNARGELGATPRSEVEVTAGGRSTALSPIPVLDVTNVIDIAAGHYHALAVTGSGQLWVWGYNLYEQLGIEMPIINYKTHTPAAMQYLPFPVRVPGLTDVVSADGGAGHSLALLKNGTIYAWGTNKMGQLGDGTTVNRPLPVRVSGIENAVAVRADGDISAALLADGRVMIWGHSGGPFAQPGLMDDTPIPRPMPVPGLTDLRDFALGGEHAVGLTRTGAVVSWGGQRLGERGHPGIAPASIPGLTNVTSIEAYAGRTFAVLANGTIMTLGHVPYWVRLEGGDKTVATFPIPLVIKGLKNPVE